MAVVVVWVELDTTYHEYGTPLNSVNVAVGKVVVVLVESLVNKFFTIRV